MLVYESDFLSVDFEKENDCFVQFWKKSPDNFEILKNEFIEFTSLYKKYKPTKTLWLQQNFRLPLSVEMHQWVEKNANIPCKENGNEKVAFVVGKDVLAHLSVMSFFNEAKSVLSPVHFATEKEARQWLNESKSFANTNSEFKILFEGVDKEGNSIIKIERSSSDITNTILSLSNLLEENNFIKSNISKYSSLTKREKQVMVTLSKGLRQQEVANELFISIDTFKTHWKHIKRKLEIKSLAEVVKYVNAFEMNNGV